MQRTIYKRLAALLSVKSLVTLTLTGIFAWMAVAGTISQDFMTIYAVIIAFYFGTQSQKVQDAVADGSTGGDTYNSYYLPGEAVSKLDTECKYWPGGSKSSTRS